MKRILSVLFVLVFASPAHAIDIQQITTDKGITAWLVESRHVPVVSMEFAFGGGSAHDPSGSQGRANLAAATLDEGAGEYDSLTFRKVLEDETISLSFTAGRERMYGSFKVLKDSADLGFELLDLSLNDPRFDDEPVARMKRQITAGIVSEQQSASFKAGEAFRSVVYGDHPFARNSDGTPESVAALTAQDMRDWLAANRAQDRLFVAVVGDISADELKARLDSLFGDWPQTGQFTDVDAVSNQQPGATEVITIDQPQTTAWLVQDALPRTDPDYYAAYVLNYILGGGQFGSRLHNEVREKRGLSYGVGSSLSGTKKAPLWFVSLQSANETVAEAVDLVKSEWARMAAEGPTDAELEAAVNYILGSYALNFTSTNGIANVLLGLQIADLGASYPTDRDAIFRALTTEDLKRVAAERLDPDALTVIVAGNPEGF